MQHCLPYTILAMQVDLISQLCSGTQTASCTYFYQHILAQRMPEQNFSAANVQEHHKYLPSQAQWQQSASCKTLFYTQ